MGSEERLQAAAHPGATRLRIVRNCRSLAVTDEEISSFVELFYRGATCTPWVVHLESAAPKNPGLLGQHTFTPDRGHCIYLFIDSIARHVGKVPVGGNRDVPRNLRVGVFMVLRHEVQHANQHVWHSSGTGFWTGRYSLRHCEVDARRSVDETIGEICAFLGEQEPPLRLLSAAGYADQLQQLADDLAPAEELTTDEVRDELRAAGLNNPICLSMLSQMLAERGCAVDG